LNALQAAPAADRSLRPLSENLGLAHDKAAKNPP